MVALAVLFSLMALLPLGFIIAIGIETGWETIKALVFRPRVAELLSNTLWLTALAVPLCIVTGVAIALTERTLLAGRGSGLRWRWPVGHPAFVQSYAGECGAFHAWAFCGRVSLRASLLPVYLYARGGGAASSGSNA